MADVFLSYANVDREQAEQLALALERSGWSVWWDRELLPGVSLQQTVDKELASAKCVLVLWSRATAGSDWHVMEEMRTALHRDILIPVLLEREVDMPLMLRSRESANLSTWTGDPSDSELRRLFQGIQRLVAPGSRGSMAEPHPGDIPKVVTLQGGSAIETHPRNAARQAATQRVFLCYRREDTQDAAGRLHDRLSATFGSDRIFMDIDSVPLGVDFVDHVTEQIAKCSAVIVMIGRQWLKIKDRKRRRLDYEDDLVRAEIRAALQQKIPVIPVIVQNAVMPRADELPEDIRPLVRRNGIELSATRWNTDVERLLKELANVIKV